jgi:hypothetical protein
MKVYNQIHKLVRMGTKEIDDKETSGTLKEEMEKVGRHASDFNMTVLDIRTQMFEEAGSIKENLKQFRQYFD